MIKPTGLSF